MHTRSILRHALVVAVAIASSTPFISCDSSSESTTDNQPGATSGTLTGSVLDQNGKGIPNVVIRLRSTGQSVSTDAKGTWSLQKQGTATRTNLASRVLETVDSILISKDSQYIASQAVVKYDAELPPLYIVQRDLYGDLSLPQANSSYAVTGYLTLPDSSTKTIPLWHNAVARSFSGFIYTVYTGNVDNYSVRVVVRNAADSQVTGLSPTVPFSSIAGDVQIPVFGYENITPVVNTKITGTTAIGNTVTLTATVGDTDIVNGLLNVDSTRNTISWKHGAQGNWTTGTNTLSVKLDTAILRDSCYYVRVEDDQDGLVTESPVCLDLSAIETRSTSAVAWTYTLNEIYQFKMLTDSTGSVLRDSTGKPSAVNTDTCDQLLQGADSMKFGNTYAPGGQVLPGDTIDLGVLDRTNMLTKYKFDFMEEVSVNSYKTNVIVSNALSSKKALSYFHLDSTGLVGSKLTKLVLWSEKAATINFFGDTVSVKAGDNVLFSTRTVTDTSYISLRLIPELLVMKRFDTNYGGVRVSRKLVGEVLNYDYKNSYGNYLLGLVDLSAMPGTFAGGKLLRNNSNANDGKFVVKALVGYK